MKEAVKQKTCQLHELYPLPAFLLHMHIIFVSSRSEWGLGQLLEALICSHAGWLFEEVLLLYNQCLLLLSLDCSPQAPPWIDEGYSCTEL
ncbi:uncharacterized [Tachysurus ichikawai]